MAAEQSPLDMIVSKAEAMNPKWRPTMEDRCVIHSPGQWEAPDPHLAYFGVYDGHGGREMVDFLEHSLSFHVAQELKEETVNIETRLVRAFLMTDVHSRGANIMSSGATVAICLVRKDPTNAHMIELTTANAGDSRVILGHEGHVTRLSQDHRVADPLEVARIEKAGGFVFRDRVLGVLALTRSLGDHLLKKYVIAHPHVHQESVELKEDASHRSFVVLACDGLFDVMSDRDVASLVVDCEKEGKADEAATYLVEEALRRRTTDNVSAIVVWL